MKTLDELAEKCGDDSSADICHTDDETACFKTGVEFGFKRGHESRDKEVQELKEMLADAQTACKYWQDTD